jgi:hypothetical protein
VQHAPPSYLAARRLCGMAHSSMQHGSRQRTAITMARPEKRQTLRLSKTDLDGGKNKEHV